MEIKPTEYVVLFLLVIGYTLGDAIPVSFSMSSNTAVLNKTSFIKTEVVESALDCSMLCSINTGCCLGHFYEDKCTMYSSCLTEPSTNGNGYLMKAEISNSSASLEILGACGNVAGTTSGVYALNLLGDVYCELDKLGGGWTVLNRRFDGSIDFYLEWEDYKNGFGNLHGEHWLGLEKLHKLTSYYQYMLRVDLEDFGSNTAYAVYSSFRVGNESTGYRLDISGYSGNAGDSLAYHNGMQFATKDKDNDAKNDGNCATTYTGAWWYNACLHSCLNGRYLGGSQDPQSRGLAWQTWKGFFISYKSATMMIKRV